MESLKKCLLLKKKKVFCLGDSHLETQACVGKVLPLLKDVSVATLFI